MNRALWGWGGLLVAGLIMGGVAGCELGGSSGGSSGTATVRGTVVVFETAGILKQALPASHETLLARAVRGLADIMVSSAAAASPHGMGGPGGITVSLQGPEDRSTVTADDGSFSFMQLPAGAYEVSFAYNGQEVMYRGRSGQAATITVASNQTAELLNIEISGGKVNIGNIRIMDND